MSWSDPKNRGPKCPACNKICIKLVPMQDNGKGEKFCRRCKRAIKAGKEIKKFDRAAARDIVIPEVEQRVVVKPK